MLLYQGTNTIKLCILLARMVYRWMPCDTIARLNFIRLKEQKW